MVTKMTMAMSRGDTCGIDLHALRQHLVSREIQCSGPLRAEAIPGSSSIDNVIVFDDSSTWVLRRPEAICPPFMQGNIFRDYRMITALWDTAVPVPHPVTSCEDPSKLGFPFTMVQYVPGVTVRSGSNLRSGDDRGSINRCVDSLLRVLADLHTIRPGTLGFTNPSLPPDHLARQVQWWTEQWERSGFSVNPYAGDVARLQRRLIATAPPPVDTSVIHGQFRIDNALLAGLDITVVRAIIDWKGAAISDPLTDVALMCAYHTRLAGEAYYSSEPAWSDGLLISGDEIAERYSRVSGRDLKHWPFHIALAYLKIATLAAVRQQHRDSQLSLQTIETVGALATAGLAMTASS